MPVVEYFEQKGKVERIDGAKAPEVVYEEVVKKMEGRGFEKEKKKEEEEEEVGGGE